MTAGLSSRLLSDSGTVPVVSQAAALCFRVDRRRPEVLLITARRSGRWIIPKGWLINGMTPAETAAQEAWEEAGVVGRCMPGSLGQFSFLKQRADTGPVLCLVDVFSLPVRSLRASFPEKGERRLKWLSPKKAAQKVASPELADIMRCFGPYSH